MTKIHLLISVEPSEVEIFANFLKKDGNYERLLLFVDTGADVSLLPDTLLDILQHRISERDIRITQAGIAKQSFVAVEAYVTVFFEDSFGNQTLPFDIPVWFAATTKMLMGFKGALDRGNLYLGMPSRTGWFEIAL